MPRRKPTLDEYCFHCLDRMYEPRLDYESQCTGYKVLRKMAEEKKYTQADLYAFHKLLRPVIIQDWNFILKLTL